MNPFRLWLLSRVCFAPEGDPPAPAPAAPPAPPPRPAATPPTDDPDGETITREYAMRMRRDAEKARTTAQAAEAAAAEAKADADRRIAAAGAAADQRIIRAEARAEAAKAGMVDLDGIALLDLSAAKVDPATGAVTGVAEAIAAAKEARKWLFGTPGTTGSTAPVPPPQPPGAKDARKMTEEEYTAERKRLVSAR